MDSGSRRWKGVRKGEVISPILANLYLHYVLDLWAQAWRKKQARGEMIIVRYADDAVLGFEQREDAEQFLEQLRERLRKFGLELHPEKTRLIRFVGRLYPASWRRRYRVEFEALIEDASRDWRDVLDVLLGAMKMQLTTWTFGKMATAFGVAGAVLWLMEGNIALRRAGRFAFNLEVLDPASLPKHPSFPNRFIIAATGLAGGLLLGALTALVARTRPSKAPAGNSPKSS